MGIVKRNLLSIVCIVVGVLMIASDLYLKANGAAVLASATDEAEREALRLIVGGAADYAIVGVMGIVLGIITWTMKGRAKDVDATTQEN